MKLYKGSVPEESSMEIEEEELLPLQDGGVKL